MTVKGRLAGRAPAPPAPPTTKPKTRASARRPPRRSARIDGVAGVELAGHLVDEVAALGDGQRHDAGARVGQPVDDGLRVVGREEQLDDAADDPRLAVAVGVLDDEGVEPVLRASACR